MPSWPIQKLQASDTFSAFKYEQLLAKIICKSTYPNFDIHKEKKVNCGQQQPIQWQCLPVYMLPHFSPSSMPGATMRPKSALEALTAARSMSLFNTSPQASSPASSSTLQSSAVRTGASSQRWLCGEFRVTLRCQAGEGWLLLAGAEVVACWLDSCCSFKQSRSVILANPFTSIFANGACRDQKLSSLPQNENKSKKGHPLNALW